MEGTQIKWICNTLEHPSWYYGSIFFWKFWSSVQVTRLCKGTKLPITRKLHRHGWTQQVARTVDKMEKWLLSKVYCNKTHFSFMKSLNLIISYKERHGWSLIPISYMIFIWLDERNSRAEQNTHGSWTVRLSSFQFCHELTSWAFVSKTKPAVVLD